MSKGINELKKEICEKLITEWEEKLNSKWGKWLIVGKTTNGFGLYIDIRGIKCGCWIEINEDKPYWGFKFEDVSDEQEVSDEQKEIIRSILKRTTDSIEPNFRNYWIAFDYDWNADIQCDKFYQVALELKYIS